jgi:serine/threonine protein kinase/Tfp pilus assembly protein PilF
MADRIDDNQENILRQAVQQFIDAGLKGQEPDLDEFVKQYPHLEHQIRRKIQNLGKIDTLFNSLLKADESDFEDNTTGEDLVGRKIGNFEIKEMIGRGGMGVVYLAHDTRLKRSVAIKCIPAGLTGDSTAKARFMREAELLASLNHQNIAVIHEIIEEDKSGYLILEYVPGQTLSEYIAGKSLKLEEALSITQQIAEAVSAAHKKGVVHRDLKPGNIKITPDGRVKVLDFGLAKPYVSEDRISDVTATEPGRIIGTPAYMSPEQARGKSIDHRTDIWSFGCIMYQMLTGHLPFESETATDTLAKIIERKPDWQALPQEVPANIRILLQNCLEKDPDKRLSDIKEAIIVIRETFSKPQVVPATKLKKIAMIIGIMVIGIILSVIALKFIPQKPSTKEIRLVVLPFENLGPADNEYFADGITDEITARLAGIHGLGVISRQSAMRYKKSNKSPQQIAQDLNVDYILEGPIQCERPSDPNSRVKIRPQLIRVANDTHVWADIYENNMSKVFRLQSDLAERVVQALDIVLLEVERKTIQSEPTKNLEAYVYYLRGNDYSSRPYQNPDNLIIAIEMYEKAIDLDDKFALAHAWLSHVYSGMYWFHGRSEKHRTMAWEESEKALNLDPELPEAHWARGAYYYWCRLDYANALEELEIALKSQPKNSRILATVGHVHRRQGKFVEALSYYKRAYELNPQSSMLEENLAGTLRGLRRYSEAKDYYEQAISLAPNEDFLHFVKATLYLIWKGNTDETRKALDRASQYINLEDKERFVNLQFELDVYEGNYEKALDRLPLKFSKTPASWTFRNSLRYAQIYGYLNNKQLADKYYMEAVENLESLLLEDPNSVHFHSALGVVYAGLGRKDDAIRMGEKAVELLPYTKDSARGFSAERDLLYIYMKVSKFDLAFDLLEDLLSKPVELSIPLIELDPAWESLCKHPRFQKLKQKYSPKNN